MVCKLQSSTGVCVHVCVCATIYVRMHVQTFLYLYIF